MAHRFVVLVALSLAAVEAAHAGDPIRSGGNFGLGLGGGLAVSGLSGKYWLAEAHALQGVVGAWGLGRAGGSSLGVGLDLVGLGAACEAYAEGFEAEHGLFGEAVDPPLSD